MSSNLLFSNLGNYINLDLAEQIFSIETQIDIQASGIYQQLPGYLHKHINTSKKDWHLQTMTLAVYKIHDSFAFHFCFLGEDLLTERQCLTDYPYPPYLFNNPQFIKFASQYQLFNHPYNMRFTENPDATKDLYLSHPYLLAYRIVTDGKLLDSLHNKNESAYLFQFSNFYGVAYCAGENVRYLRKNFTDLSPTQKKASHKAILRTILEDQDTELSRPKLSPGQISEINKPEYETTPMLVIDTIFEGKPKRQIQLRYYGGILADYNFNATEIEDSQDCPDAQIRCLLLIDQQKETQIPYISIFRIHNGTTVYLSRVELPLIIGKYQRTAPSESDFHVSCVNKMLERYLSNKGIQTPLEYFIGSLHPQLLFVQGQKYGCFSVHNKVESYLESDNTKSGTILLLKGLRSGVMIELNQQQKKAQVYEKDLFNSRLDMEIKNHNQHKLNNSTLISSMLHMGSKAGYIRELGLPPVTHQDFQYQRSIPPRYF